MKEHPMLNGILRAHNHVIQNNMSHYTDAFAFAIRKDRLEEYISISVRVGEIWKKYGALDYRELVSDGLEMQGTRSFRNACDATNEEVVLFGWTVFASRAERDAIHEKVRVDKEMLELVAPLFEGPVPAFDASRMLYGGFQ